MPSLGMLQSGGLFMGALMLYGLLLVVNIIHQRLRASGVKEALAWYAAPTVLIMAAFVASLIY